MPKFPAVLIRQIDLDPVQGPMAVVHQMAHIKRQLQLHSCANIGDRDEFGKAFLMAHTDAKRMAVVRRWVTVR